MPENPFAIYGELALVDLKATEQKCQMRVKVGDTGCSRCCGKPLPCPDHPEEKK